MIKFDALKACFPEARPLSDGAVEFVHLQALPIDTGGTTATLEALLCPQQHGGYMTRLFLSQPLTGKGGGGAWTTHVIFGRTWHTWSYNHVPADLPVLEILLNHLRALR